MAKCPACAHEVRTPWFFDLEGWRHLTCAQCKARLEMKPPRSVVLVILMAPLFVLAREGRVFEAVAFAFMVGTIFFLLLESLRPHVRLRTTPLPKPEIRLDLDRPAH